MGALVALGHHRLSPDGSPLPSGPLAYVAAKSGGVALTRQFAVVYGHQQSTSERNRDRWNRHTNATCDNNTAAGDFSPADAIHQMRRIAQPEEIASAALFFASAEASFITGVALPVDGGCTAK